MNMMAVMIVVMMAVVEHLLGCDQVEALAEPV
jgi:hypothetical protein